MLHKKGSKWVLLLFILFAGIVLLNRFGINNQSILVAKPTQSQSVSSLPRFFDRQNTIVTVGEKEITVEVVNSPESTTQGLSGRESIGADGMLFIFPKKGELRFWMKDMRFDLDMIWIENQTVVDISPNVPKPETTDLTLLPTYSPKVPASMVLEVMAGKAAEWGVVDGSQVRFSQL